MAVPKGRILIDWEEAMSSDPALEVEFVGSSSPVTRDRPTAARAVIDDGSDGDDGIRADFANLSDEKLREKISSWRFDKRQGVLAATPDGGEKMRIHVRRMEKELERRQIIQQKKEDTVRGQQAKLAGGSSEDPLSPYNFNTIDEISDSMPKYVRSPCPTSNIKTRVKAKVQRPFSQHKHAYSTKNGQKAKTSARHQLKAIEIHPKSSAKSLNMYNDSTDRTRKRPLRSCNRRQKNNNFDSKDSWNKLIEDATFGSDSDKRWICSKKKASPYFKFKRDVVHVDLDDDTEPARLAEIEMSDKWDASKIYYPSSTDSGAVDLTHSDMKCLEPEEYLKSPIINFYIQYLKNSRPREDLYMFNTYFYCKLEDALSTMGNSDSQFIKLRRWWKSVDIFKKSYIILPIHEMMHWSLIIVCMPTNKTESGPVILHLDSLGLHPSQKLFDIVRRFLEAEWRHLQKDSSYDIPFSRKIWECLPRNIDKKKVQVPRQQNEYDCGLFMLYYNDRFIQDAPERLTREELRMFGCKWFEPKDASGLREGILSLVFDVFQNAQEDDGSSVSESQLGHHSEGDDKDVNTDTIMLDDV
ncbi:hypothetical protein QOZ80_1AG0032450 [Eleusine coracana subsp. coracana]|nr:hypothetical protein QOZ80_1AG0032450 [Eleusine coracana subsp. coracana]